MPRFQRHSGYYTYEPRRMKRRYVVKKNDDGEWVAEAYKVEDGRQTDLRIKFTGLPSKRDASTLVDHWIENRL